jgi:cytidylate kinase
MLLTVSGPPGSGKSTVAKAISIEFDMEYISGGVVFRGIAEDRGISVGELNKIAESDDSIDRDMDQNIEKIAQTLDDAVIESRLAGWMAGENADIRIWIDAPIEIRSERIFKREGGSVEKILRETAEREMSEKKRYKEYYGIDFEDLSIYDCVVDTDNKDAETVIKIVTEFINKFDL